MRRPVCFNCDFYVPTDAEEGLCTFNPPSTGLKVRLIVIVDGEEVSGGHARTRETHRGYYPSIPPTNPACRFHPELPAWKNEQRSAGVGDEDDDPFGAP